MAARDNFIGNGILAQRPPLRPNGPLPQLHTRYWEFLLSPTLLEWVLNKMGEHTPALLRHGLFPDFQHADPNLDSDRNKRISCVLAGQGEEDTLEWAFKEGMRAYPQSLAAAAGAGRVANVRLCISRIPHNAGHVVHGNAIVMAARSGHTTVRQTVDTGLDTYWSSDTGWCRYWMSFFPVIHICMEIVDRWGDWETICTVSTGGHTAIARTMKNQKMFKI